MYRLLWCGFGIGVAGLSAIILTVGWWYVSGGRVYGVQTGSMSPLIVPGDAVIVRPVTPGSLRVGDIIAYRSAAEPAVVISHRLLAVNRQTATLTTKGDHNHQADASISEGQVMGRVVAIAPWFGAAASWLRKPLNLALCIVLPIAVVLFSELRRWYHDGTRVLYRLPGR